MTVPQMKLEHVWVRFTVVAKDQREARAKVRRALRTIELGSGCTEAMVSDDPSEEMKSAK